MGLKKSLDKKYESYTPQRLRQFVTVIFKRKITFYSSQIAHLLSTQVGHVLLFLRLYERCILGMEPSFGLNTSIGFLTKPLFFIEFVKYNSAKNLLNVYAIARNRHCLTWQLQPHRLVRNAHCSNCLSLCVTK